MPTTPGQTEPVPPASDVPALQQRFADRWPPTVLIAVGAMIGASLRWWGESATTGDGRSVVLAAVNLIGAALVGWLAGWGWEMSSPVWSFLVIGVAGGLTSFSSFALDVARRLDHGSPGTALGLVVFTVTVTIIGSLLGHRAAVMVQADRTRESP
jgi:fluoride exporter